MPEVATESSQKSTTQGPLRGSLKRNQACHQCRRRKLKCDAQRPTCTTCIRSHSYAIANATSGSTSTPALVCTYDEDAENTENLLENRITELTNLLAQKQDAEVSLTCQLQAANDKIAELSQSLLLGHTVKTTALSYPQVQPEIAMPGSPDTPDVIYPGHLMFEAGISPTPEYCLDLTCSSWPSTLPRRPILVHLVDVFFKFHPHAHRLFYRPRFLTGLSLPPSHPNFPCQAVLHAICAMGSLYTPAVTTPPRPTFDEFPADEVFLERQRLKEHRPESFAEQQAQHAKEEIDRLNVLGKDLFQMFQASVVLTWFYWVHGRWADVFFGSGFSMRIASPLGLNMCGPFHSITKSHRPTSLLPLARTVIEDETRRNAFWLAYASERLYGFGNPWALNLDDLDISQLLPVPGEDFDRGQLVLPQDRQWAHTPSMLLENPERATDPFTLYIKGSILLSRVKTFNMRFRARYFAGDPAMSPSEFHPRSEGADPRGLQAFLELDSTISSFTSSFPGRYKDPIMNNIVDNHLFAAFLMPSVATIVLHDPHADVQRSGCTSALKILTAARAILHLMYRVCSTSFDITLLDTFCTSALFWSGRVLVRFLKAAQDTDAQAQCAIFEAELEFLQSTLTRQGERIPLAFRYTRMLDHLFASR